MGYFKAFLKTGGAVGESDEGTYNCFLLVIVTGVRCLQRTGVRGLVQVVHHQCGQTLLAFVL